jgi:2-polyprenyl-3-methyl-5-hydroxy-6-metoxy-1,4-benzoquinol methylase
MPAPRTSEFFDAYARDFDAIYGTRNTLASRLINRHLRKSMRLRYERVLAGCRPVEGRSVIDVGCGPGHYAVALAQMGAARVVGVDFAPGMIEIARERARRAGVEDRCEFACADAFNHPAGESFDYAVVMGFMDYVEAPRRLVERVVSMTKSRSFFSFPAAGGVLAWQRKLRYRHRCPLFLYARADLDALFEGLPVAAIVDRIARDYFVVAERRPRR